MTDTDTTYGRLASAEQHLREARSAWYAELPDFPADGHCADCGGTEWIAMEIGYSRWTSGEWVEPDEDEQAGHLHLYTDGWDDMSESGEFEWIECDQFRSGGCGKEYKVPDEREWD